MAAAPLAALHRKLFDETDGVKFSKLKDRLLKKHAAEERQAVLDILTAYAREGQLLHWRAFLMTDIVALAEPGEYGDFFSWSLEMDGLAYWGVDGMLKSMGKEAYARLVALAAAEDAKLSVRAKAVKSLAVFSRQPFDAGLPTDPGHWKAERLGLTDVLAWQRDGYPDGAGHALPVTHAALEDPRSPLEKAAARLEKKLAARRKKEQDLAQPSNWLTIASAADMAGIAQRWTLPEHYRRFLACHSPLRVYIDSPLYFQGLSLYGAAELVKAQHGYAWNPVSQETIAGWPDQYLVIADAGADPYCLDLGNIADGDAPVYHAEHGMGAWRFERHADSFIDFLNEIAAAA
ncbi:MULTISPECIES: SMI1/KNR4 family protein [unclassified Janthinobacterium]|uniref:SMI1/KNR4 family protein n=1 Tax=unclassified Janthinobacterium TaxID=2610881 RepID=UPI001E32A0F6|nr:MULTISPECIES: SMI1/KNR4 family protein [unclassified Janthinobacterium]MCC7645420.1 SMI1/KNR4 family protein [Janthinobacterium sp. EB271-G4-3-1]MCC7690476.1 SMI1/KNR4 family protein [Janthinobacterium sp. EB271-G4-3-2]